MIDRDGDVEILMGINPDDQLPCLRLPSVHPAGPPLAMCGPWSDGWTGLRRDLARRSRSISGHGPPGQSADCAARQADRSTPGHKATRMTCQTGRAALHIIAVVGVADRAHRRPDAGLLAAPPEGEGRVLAALIGVVNQTRRPALPDGHVQGV